MLLKSLYRKFRKWYFGHESLINVFLHKQNFLDNLKEYKNKYPELSFSPVLKSNAYGHGIIEIGKIIDKENLPFVSVDSYYEARTLRLNNFKTKILIIGYNDAKQILKNKFKNISWSIASMPVLQEIANTKYPISVHLKFNTGMNRLGFEVNEFDKILEILKNNKNIIVEGVYSHFADSDGVGNNFTLAQGEIWNTLVRKIRQEISDIKYFHIGATGGVKFSQNLDANVFRLGKGFYGYYADDKDIVDLIPGLSMETKVISIRNIKAGDFVGYSFGFKASTDMKIAVLPVGYNEGLDKRLSNIGAVKIQNKYCPIVGKISMNMCTVDVSEIENLKIGEKVEVISNITSDENSIQNIAKICQTNQAEILIHINSQLNRVVI